MRKISSLNRTLHFEQLEERAVLNGTVTATNTGGMLTITGDAANNAIIVHQIGKNSDGSGAIIQVQGAGTRINNLDTGVTGNSASFGSDSGNGVTIIDIELGGGSDVLTFYNTTVTGAITVNMDDPASGGVGDGNDVLVMANVHSTSDTITIGLGNGTNVASLFRVSSGSDFTLNGGSGRDIVALNSVTSNASPESSNDTFIVDLGSGNFDTLAVVNCSDSTDGTGMFSDEGTNAIVTGVINHFAHQTVTGFRFRYGDLRNDVA